MTVNRQWLLARRPKGALAAEDLEYREVPVPEAGALLPGEVLLRNRVFLCAPTMRNWMEPPGNSLYPSIPLGKPVMAPAGCEVVASARLGVAAGDKVFAFTSWQDFQKIGPDHPVTLLPKHLSLVEVLGPYGLNARTAYFGLLKVGQPREGETLVVSGAAGSTGCVAAQIGKILGCHVIGIAGGSEKCRWLVDECGLDAAIDYREGRVLERLAKLCPGGIDIFYDNVGGAILQAAIENMAKYGRVILCGQIASYNEGGPAPGPENMMRLIYGRSGCRASSRATMPTRIRRRSHSLGNGSRPVASSIARTSAGASRQSRPTSTPCLTVPIMGRCFSKLTECRRAWVDHERLILPPPKRSAGMIRRTSGRVAVHLARRRR